jgi:hypothetical protein
MPAEAEGLEPPRACARRISSAVPYQLGLRLQTSDEPGPGRPSRLTKPTIGAPGFEPGTSATRTQRSTGLSHAPRTQPHPPRVCAPERTGWDSNPRGCLAPHDFQSCALSRSATRPENPDESGDTRPCSTLPGSIPTRSAPESGRGTSTNGGSGIRTAGEWGWRQRRHRSSTHASPRRRRGPWVQIPTHNVLIYPKRREWDSNPRGP